MHIKTYDYSKNLLLLIIEINNIHKFNILKLNLWLLCKNILGTLDYRTLTCLDHYICNSKFENFELSKMENCNSVKLRPFCE
jgi:hypothetical protein